MTKNDERTKDLNRTCVSVPAGESDDPRLAGTLRLMLGSGRSRAERDRLASLSDGEVVREARARASRHVSEAAAAEVRARGGKRRYVHTAYWFAKQAAKEKEREKARWREGRRRPRRTFTERFVEMAGDSRRRWQGSRDPGSETLFCDPIAFLAAIPACLAADIGYAVWDTARAVVDPVERARTLAELRRQLRILRRPAYYRQETERRHALARERRQVARRTTLAEEPTAAQVLEAWERRKESKERMILLGGLLQDLECFVDNRLRFDGDGKVVGRNAGIKGWIDENLPQLNGKYKTLMRYKAMAVRLRQVTETEDPTPTEAVLHPSHPRHDMVKGLLEDFRKSFSFLDGELKRRLDPGAVFTDEDMRDAAAANIWYSTRHLPPRRRRVRRERGTAGERERERNGT